METTWRINSSPDSITIQQQPQTQAEQVNNLIQQLSAIDVESVPTTFPRKAIEKTFRDLNAPLTTSLTEAKESLMRQAECLTPDIEHLQRQIKLLDKINKNKRTLLESYVVVLGSIATIDAHQTNEIYDAMSGRMASVARKIQKLIDSIFKGTGHITDEEATLYKDMIRNEGEILQTFLEKPNKTHIAYNALLTPPCYTQLHVDEAYKQDQVTLNYQKQVVIFISTLSDDTKTLAEIQLAASSLEGNKTGWQNQIALDQDISNLISEMGKLKEQTQHAIADLKERKDGLQSPLRLDKKIRESEAEISHNEIEIRVLEERIEQLTTLRRSLDHNGELLSHNELMHYQSQHQNIISLYLIKVESVDSIVNNDRLEKIFEHDYCAGFIKTAIPDRTYKYSWDKSTERITVQRDKSDSNKLDLLDEKLGNWNRGDLKNISDKLKYKLMALRLAMLTIQIRELNIEVHSPYPDLMIGKTFTDIKTPLLESLDRYKQIVFLLAERITSELNKNLANAENKPLSDQQIADHLNAMIGLKQQAILLIKLSHDVQEILNGYFTAIPEIDIKYTDAIYQAILIRLTSITKNIQPFIDSESKSEKDTIDYHSMIQNERAIIDALINPQITIHRSYTALSKPPHYSDTNSSELKRQTVSDYSRHFLAFTNILMDDTQTQEQIQQAADKLSEIRNQWQNQIKAAEEIGQLIQKINQNPNRHSVLAKSVNRLGELQQNLFNNGERLERDKVISYLSEYQQLLADSTQNIDGKDSSQRKSDIERRNKFKEKSAEIKDTLWDVKYQMLKNEETLADLGHALESLQQHSESLEDSSRHFKESSQKLKNSFTFTGQISNAISRSTNSDGISPKIKKSKSHQEPVSDHFNVGYSLDPNFVESGLL